jgi:hypothetical protein
VEERTSRSYHDCTNLEPQEVIQHGTLPQIRAVCQAGLLPLGAPHPPGEPPAAAGAKLLPLAHRPLLPLAYRSHPSAAPALEIPHKPALHSRASLPPADPGPGAPLALDWTRAGGYELLVAALPWRGRALPVWAAVCAGSWQGIHTSRNHLEHAFIAAVTSALRAVRPQMRLVWIADRGFARLSLFQFLASLGVDFCIRVNAKTKIAWRGRNLLLSELAVKPGQTLWLEGVSYRPQGRPFERGGIRVNLLVAWKRPTHRGTPQAPQPWYVVTSLESPQQALAYYRRRMRIEEGFRDWKQRLGLRQAAVSTVERMARLLVGLVLATLVLALLGLFGLPAGFRRAVLGRGKGSWLWFSLAAGGASQAAGAPQGAEARSTRRRLAMIQKVERRQEFEPLTSS